MMRGLLVTAYGTSRDEARRCFVEPLVSAVVSAFRADAGNAGAPVREAYTSARARSALAERGECVLDPASALEELWDAGVRDVTVVSTHLVDGTAYAGLRRAVTAKAPLFDTVRLSAPLLSSASDAHVLARAIDAHLPLEPGCPIVLVGHGASGVGQLAYLALQGALDALGRSDIHIGLLRGEPSFDKVIRVVEAHSKAGCELLLAPLMIASAGHAERDILGVGSASWRSRFEAAGYAVRTVAMGLGAWPEVQRLAASHLENAQVVECGVPALPMTRNEHARFPLFVDLSGARCLVVGCGKVGERRARALARFGAMVSVIDPQAEDLEGEGITVCRRAYAAGDEAGCALVVAATDNRAVNHTVAERCRRLRIPVSVADAPQECTFFFPALCEGEQLVAGVASRAGDAAGHALVARAAAAIRRELL